MFESDIERSKIRLLELVNSTQPTVYLNDILGRASIDYAYKQYFEAEFGWWLYEEQTLRQTNPNLDLNDPSTVGILNNLDTQYRKHARFDREQLMLIIDSAVKCVLNYRVRPRTSLKWFVFRGEPTKPIYEVYLRMRYFADYRYLHEGFNQWLLKRGLRYDSLDIISVLEFERLIKKIDDDTILELSPSQFVDLISPINYFFAELSADPTAQSIPIEAVIIFLDDKEVYIIAQKLERMLYQQGIRQLTKEMFLSVVDEVLSEMEGDRVDESTNTEADSDGSAEGDAPLRQRSSASELIRPTGSVESESVLRAGLSASAIIAGLDSGVRGGVETEGDGLSAVSVIEQLSRRTDEHSEAQQPSESDEDNESNATLSGHTESAETLSGHGADFADAVRVPSVASEEPTAVSASGEEAPRNQVEYAVDEAGELPAASSPHNPSSSLFTQSAQALSADRGGFVVKDAVGAKAPSDSDGSAFTSIDSLESHGGTESSQSVATHSSELYRQETDAEYDDLRNPSHDTVQTEPKAADAEKVTETSAVDESVPVREENTVDTRSASALRQPDNDNPPTLDIISRALGTDRSTDVDTARSPYFENAVRVHTPEEQSVDTRVFPSISSFYDDRQREGYIKRLCNKDAARFDELVGAIDQTRNWKEALAFLDKFYSQQSIDPNAAVARDFRMAVYKRFIAL